MKNRAKNTQVNFRMNDELLTKAKEIVHYEDMDMSTLFNNLLENIVSEDSVPYALLNAEKSKKERIAEELFLEIKKRIR